MYILLDVHTTGTIVAGEAELLVYQKLLEVMSSDLLWCLAELLIIFTGQLRSILTYKVMREQRIGISWRHMAGSTYFTMSWRKALPGTLALDLTRSNTAPSSVHTYTRPIAKILLTRYYIIASFSNQILTFFTAFEVGSYFPCLWAHPQLHQPPQWRTPQMHCIREGARKRWRWVEGWLDIHRPHSPWFPAVSC